MPKLATKAGGAATPPAAKKAPAPRANGKPKTAAPETPRVVRDVVYPDLCVTLRYDGAEKHEAALAALPPELRAAVPIKFGGPVTEAEAKKLLGWETAAEFKARTGQDLAESGWVNNPDGAGRIPYISFEDANGERVVCWNNTNNRPFGRAWALELAQEVLTRCWAGPLAFPGETVNGSTWVISRTAQVEQGNHSACGLVFACQLWRKDLARWAAQWPAQPVLETVVITGVSDSPKVIRTMDHTRPRSDADGIYTSDMFRDLDPLQKREMSRYLERATALLWTRLGAGVRGGEKVYRTASISDQFRRDHPKLLDCLAHLFERNNQGRAVSKLRLGTGAGAALMYLMAASKTDPAKYRANPCEKSLDLSRFKQAKDFWFFLTTGKLPKVEQALKRLHDEEADRSKEKHMVLAKGWAAFLADPDMADEQLDLSLQWGDDGKLAEHPTFEGADIGEGTAAPASPDAAGEEPPDDAGAEARKALAKAAREKVEREKKLKAGQPLTLKEQLDAYHDEHGEDTLLMFRVPGENGKATFKLWDVDATAGAPLLGINIIEKAGMAGLSMAQFDGKTLPERLQVLADKGRRVMIVSALAGGVVKVEEPAAYLAALNGAASPAPTAPAPKKLKGGTSK